jgi:hypothetical protein
MAVKHSSLRSPRGSPRRHLQGNKNNDKNNNQVDTPSPTQLPTTQLPTPAPGIPTLSPTQSPFAVIKPSFLSFEGTVQLTWSHHLTFAETQFSSVMMPELTEWIGQEFLCQQNSILLTSNLALESDCDSVGSISNSTTTDQARAIIWNTPTAIATVETLPDSDIAYTLWSVNFPVYAEFYNDLQQDLQLELDTQIIEEALLSPLEDALLSIVGEEVDFFAFFTNNTADGANSTGTESPTMTSYPTSSFTPSPTAITSDSAADGAASVIMKSYPATILRGVGIMTAILHTILLIGLHVFGKSYLKKRLKETRRKNGAQPSKALETTKPKGSKKSSNGSGDAVEYENEDQQLACPSSQDDLDVGLELLLMATKKESINKRDSTRKSPSPLRTEYYNRSRTPSPLTLLST